MAPSRLFAASCVAGGLALAVACSATPTLPLSPSALAGGDSTATGDATLKVHAPALIAPADGAIFEAADDISLEFQSATALYVTFSVAYEIQLARSDGSAVYSDILGAAGANQVVSLPKLPAGDYEWQVRGAQGDGRGPWSALYKFTVKPPARAAAATGKRTPDPPAGARLPAPNMVHVVIGVANQYPHFLFNSCQDHGGNWDFMDTVIDTLRLDDTRWGYAWKRGVVGDPLLDILSYNWSSAPDEGTRNIYTIDILLGHCGSSPTPTWINTQPDGGPGLSAWTGRGRF